MTASDSSCVGVGVGVRTSPFSISGPLSSLPSSQPPSPRRARRPGPGPTFLAALRWALVGVVLITTVGVLLFPALAEPPPPRRVEPGSEAAAASADAEGPMTRSRDFGSGRIRYRLVRKRPKQKRYERYSCFVRPLPDGLKGRPGLVDFVPDATATNHTTIVVGDSVALQIAHSLTVGWGVSPDDHLVHEAGPRAREVAWPGRGGGAVVVYRYPFLFDRVHRNDIVTTPTTTRTTRTTSALWQWNRTQMEEVLALRPIPTTPWGGADVVVQRVSHPWVALGAITPESLAENANVVVDAFKPTTLILVNMIFNNNVLTPKDYADLLEKREVVRTFGRGGDYAPPANGTLRRILVLDMDLYTDLLNEANGRGLGFDTSSEPFEHWMLGHVVKPIRDNVFATHMAHVCAERVDNGTKCEMMSLVSKDGMHVCESTVNGRVTAGLACLMACAERDDEHLLRDQKKNNNNNYYYYYNWWRRHAPPARTTKEGPAFDLRQCERQCNRKFMSLDPIPASEIYEWNETAGTE